VLGDQRAKVYVTGSGNGLAGELLTHVNAHLIAPPADCRAEMNRELVRGQAVARERLNCFRSYLRDRTPPAGMNQRNNARWVSDEDGDAVGDAHGECRSLLGSDMAVSFATAQPSFPTAGVNEDTITVDLPNRNQSTRCLGQIPLHRTPTPHHLFDRIVAGKSEGAGISGGRERADSPSLEVGYDFFGDFGQLSAGDRQRG